MNVELKICRCESPYLNQISYTIARARLHNTHMYCNNRKSLTSVPCGPSMMDYLGTLRKPPETHRNGFPDFLIIKSLKKKYIY